MKHHGGLVESAGDHYMPGGYALQLLNELPAALSRTGARGDDAEAAFSSDRSA